MSRISINRRLDRVREALLPSGSLAWRVDRLPDDLKRAYLIWRERADAIIHAAEKRGGGTLYAMILAGDHAAPPMPIAVERALWPDGLHSHNFPIDTPLRDLSDAYSAMLEAGYER